MCHFHPFTSTPNGPVNDHLFRPNLLLPGLIFLPFVEGYVFLFKFNVKPSTPVYQTALVAVGVLLAWVLLLVALSHYLVPPATRIIWATIGMLVDAGLHDFDADDRFRPFSENNAELVQPSEVASASKAEVGTNIPAASNPRKFERVPRPDPYAVVDEVYYLDDPLSASTEPTHRLNDPISFWSGYAAISPDEWTGMDIPAPYHRLRTARRIVRLSAFFLGILALAPVALYAGRRLLPLVHRCRKLVSIGNAFHLSLFHIADAVVREIGRDMTSLPAFGLIALFVGCVSIGLLRCWRNAGAELAVLVGSPFDADSVLASRRRVRAVIAEIPLVPRPPELVALAMSRSQLRDRWGSYYIQCSSCNGKGGYTTTSTRMVKEQVQDHPNSDGYGVYGL